MQLVSPQKLINYNVSAFLIFSCIYFDCPAHLCFGPKKPKEMHDWKILRLFLCCMECISSILLGFPPHRHTNPALSPLIATETSDTEITTTEIIKRRDVGPYGIRSEYCIRKIICPLGVPETPKGKACLNIPDTEERDTQMYGWESLGTSLVN